MFKNKKGMQLSQAVVAIVTLVSIAILVIIAIYLFTSIGSSFPTISATVVNETGTVASTSGYVLTNASQCNFASASIITIINGTGTVISSGNYTLTGNKIFNTTGINFAGGNVTYSYIWGGNGCTATQAINSSFGTFPALVGLVGTIIFLGLVIGVLVAAFAFGRRNKGA